MKSKEQKLIYVKVSFIDEISGLAISKILDESTYNTMLIKLKFIHNTSSIKHSKQWHRNYHFQARRNDRICRFEVIRLLQNQTRHITTEF